MSDAIVLDVLSSSPVQLDAGDADPIAREEITELATRVTTVEGDVSGLSTRMGAVEGDVTALDGRMDAAEGDISTLGTTVDGIDARVEAIEADYVTSEDVMGALGGEAPTLVSGSSRAMLGDPETASWMERTTAADGAALIDAIYGNTVVQDGSLLPVRMTGVETVGFNQWDEQWETGVIDSDGTVNHTYTNRKTTSFIRVIPATEYYQQCPDSALFGRFAFYDANKNLVQYNVNGFETHRILVPSNALYLRITFGGSYGTAYNHDICINISDPARNGTYEPYWSSERTIPAATYFPQGLRSAGSVYDELRADAAVTRVGERSYQSGDESDASVITDGTVTHYALATPTTTTIDPPLPMSYRVGAGGTERVMVASGTTSAPPIFVTRYPLDPADLAASIAPRESATAEANHAVGDLIMLGWTLCKVTTAIARGEAITIGTNVTQTSVAAEIAALS